MLLSEVAEWLAVNNSTIYRLVKRGKIPYFRVGSELRFRCADLVNWLDAIVEMRKHKPQG